MPPGTAGPRPTARVSTGRIAATTARQVILQRLRDAESEKTFGDFATHEGEIVGGVVQADARANAREMIVVAIGSDANSVEGVIPSRHVPVLYETRALLTPVRNAPAPIQPASG